MAGGAATAVVASGQERSTGRIVDDITLWTAIKKDLVLGHKDFKNTGVIVHEARVLLTGIVQNPKIRNEASKIVWRHEGVKEVINEIQITDKDSIKNAVKDISITGQVKGKLLLAKGIRYSNYKLTTVNNVVYLIGIAPNQEELSQITDIAGRVAGVKKVVSYIRLRDSDLRSK
ncbi:BON domain-containing protein [Rickettsiales bacterium]|nr:BON domain-containing protein [Rickettsiales bacterium]